MPDESVDAIVCDPPYFLGFMGKAFDSQDGADKDPSVAYERHLAWTREALRVLKPGGHLVAFGGSRTVHRLTCAIEDAGFEIRDMGLWLYYSGFPKSLDVSKAIDAAAGAEREVVGDNLNWRSSKSEIACPQSPIQATVTAPATPEAAAWSGWGTALKPSHEPWILARKPLIGTVAANVLKHGTGALNIDGCRYAYGDPAWPGPNGESGWATSGAAGVGLGGTDTFKIRPRPADECQPNALGRFPANVYACPKASRSEREAGCEHLAVGVWDETREPDAPGGNNPRNRGTTERGNTHSTVKPIALMRWLVRLVTPPGGTVLDPFLGSGTTACAALAEGFDVIGIEREPDYMKIAEARVRHANEADYGGEQLSLFRAAPAVTT